MHMNRCIGWVAGLTVLSVRPGVWLPHRGDACEGEVGNRRVRQYVYMGVLRLRVQVRKAGVSDDDRVSTGCILMTIAMLSRDDFTREEAEKFVEEAVALAMSSDASSGWVTWVSWDTCTS